MRLFFILLVVAALGWSRGSDVVELTEENFDSLVADGTWMVKVFAPWCSHCRKVRPVWEELATLLKDEGIHIASIDGSKEAELVSRFDTTGFPSFYHLKDGQCREYEGQRTVQSFADFARSGYRSVNPMPFYRAPNGPVEKLAASVKRFPSKTLELYEWLHVDRQWSQFAIFAAVLCVPVSFGLGMICLMDCLITRCQRRPHAD